MSRTKQVKAKEKSCEICSHPNRAYINRVLKDVGLIPDEDDKWASQRHLEALSERLGVSAEAIYCHYANCLQIDEIMKWGEQHR